MANPARLAKNAADASRGLRASRIAALKDAIDTAQRSFPSPAHVDAAVNGDMAGTVGRLIKGTPEAIGGNASFYGLPDSNMGVRVVRWTDLPPVRPDYKLEYASDPFGGKNFGQAVATYGPPGAEHPPVQVLWRQQGEPAGISHGRHGDPAEIERYRSKLEAAADLPLDAYANAMEDMKFLHSRGYSVDPSKSGNLLLNKSAGSLGFVDVNPGAYRAPANVVGTMLADNYAFHRTGLDADPRARSLLRGIVDKTTRAARQTGLPLGGGSSWDYTIQMSQPGYSRPAPTPSAPTAPSLHDVW